MKNVPLTAIIIFIASSLSAQWTDNGTSLTTSDNVGVGTTTPMAGLHVFVNEDTISWPAVINNHRNSATISNYGIGLMLKHSSNNELYKWGGIASIQESSWANSSGLALYANETEYVRIRSNGNVGIGISSPVSKLHLYHNDSEVSANVGLTIEQDGTGDSKLQFLLTGVQRWVAGIDNSNGDKFIIGRGLDWSQSKNFVIDNSGHVGIGTLTPSKEFEVNGTILSNNFMSSASNTTYNHFIRNGTGAALYINQVESNASLPILRLSSGTATANQNVRFTVENDGSVGIGTTNLEGYRLAVNGSIRSKEVKVEANWSDFVFYDDYKLRTLEEVEQHIAEKGHLPEMPSEAEVTENGINLGEMNAKLLQKIEELTLYMIEMNKRMKQLEAENHEFKEKVKSLENE